MIALQDTLHKETTVYRKLLTLKLDKKAVYVTKVENHLQIPRLPKIPVSKVLI